MKTYSATALFASSHALGGRVQRFIHRRTALNGFNLSRSPRWMANVRTQNVLAGNKAAFITLWQTRPMRG